APMSATLSFGLWRSTLEPPTLNVSLAPYRVGYAPRVVRMKTIPGVSAMIRVSLAVWLGSLGYRTVEPWIARIEARSSRAIGEGRVGDLAVHRHDLGDGSQREQRVAIRLTRGDLVFFLVGRQHRLRSRRPLGHRAALWLLGLDLQVLDPAELLDRALGHVRRQ